ncbi:sigma-54-dependent transcriptional regulator [Deferrisoma camini]|uniref:sigma-54-dependent transcriptional regulator n=1 Tax=Deferrisoma camini TaxID=1035120 RepID=UPI00046D7FA7|nr:sigma-54 dependent transcriptional regulator [Deferrisoma camini]
MTRILVIDDEESIRMTLEEGLGAEGHEVLSAPDATRGQRVLKREPVDLVIQDLMLPDAAGLDLLAWIRREVPEVPVVVITAFGSVETAVQAVKMGAYDFLEKPFDLDHVRLVASRALESGALARRVGQFERCHLASFNPDEVIRESPAMREVMGRARRAARSPSATVLITGETGTGKEVVARTIHFLSPRAANPLFEVNCAAIPATLLESEFFGHEKGAFTGARTGRKGLLEEADGSTLLLDEVGEMPLDLQAKLLRFLEDGTVRRVGSARPRRVDVRIVAMTNRDLEARVADGSFRADLFYRLNVVPIHVPPLRERAEDVGPLLRFFVRRTSVTIGRRPPEVHDDVVRALQRYPWPGNVRELRNLVERILLLEDVGDELLPAHLPAEFRGRGGPEGPPAEAPDELPAFSEAHDALTRRLLTRALGQAEGNITRASQLLRIDRATFRYHARRLGVPLAPRAPARGDSPGGEISPA